MLGNNPSTLDPTFLIDVYGGAVVRQIFDGLVQFDAELNPMPAIAEFWEASHDGRIWTFTLRQGVRFHHGREVTAQDFVYSFSRFLNSQKSVPVTKFFLRVQGAQDFMQGKTQHVEGLKALDRYTLQLLLEEPLAPSLLLLALANAYVVPQEEVERQEERFGRSPVGTGPFKFVRWEQNKEIVLEANDQYYEGRPFLNMLVYKIVAGSRLEERFAEFLRGDLEETIIPSDKTEEVRTNPQYQRYQRVSRPALSLIYIGFNTQPKPFDDKRVRQAFNYAVNKEAIVREITQMRTLPATGALPPGMLGYDPELQGYPYDPAKAELLLAEAGYPHGAGFPVVQLWTGHKAESTKAELTAYQQYLAHVGVQVEIHFAPDWPTYQSMLEQGKLSMFRLAWYADFPDPDNILSPLLHSANPTNRTFYRHPQVDQLLEQARKEFNDVQRVALYRRVERLVIDDAPWIPQHHEAFVYLYQPYVRGIEVNLLGHTRAIPMKEIWLHKSLPESSKGTPSGNQ
jgi:oligopeptide transport system substrate-binding protein